MQQRNKREPESFFRPWHLILVVIAVGYLVYYSVTVMVKAYTVNPENLYAEFFTNSRDRIHNLEGGGDISSVFDEWLTFQCPDIIRFKNPKMFVSEGQPQRAWHYFIEKYPHEKDLQTLADLEGWSMSDHPDPVRLVNAWLVCNKKTNRYWFRTWGRK